jgi:hypothetical protein
LASESDAKIEQPYPDTEELIYAHIKEAPQQQMEVADKLDDKMLRIFGAASVVLGFLSLASASSLGWKIIFFLFPLLPYACTACCTFRHVNPDRFR